MTETLYIIDGHSQIFRAYYSPFRDLTSPTGEPTRATYVFMNILLKFIADNEPTYLAMAVDGPARELKRRELYDQYKITRKPIPDDFFPQEKRIMQLVEAMGIPILRAKGYEADDIIATAAQRFATDDLKVILVSRDKDLDQLVTQNVALYDPMSDTTYDPAAILAKKGYPPEKAVEIQTLTGDTIDNIPGIKGVGPKTAVTLIAKYGSAAAAVAAAAEQTPALKKNLQAGAETLALTRQLVTLDRDVPIDLNLAAMKLENLNYAAILPIFEELNFTRLIEKLPGIEHTQPQPANAAGQKSSAAASPAKTGSPAAVASAAEPAAVAEIKITTAADFDYRLIDTAEQLREIAAQLKAAGRFAVDTETTDVRPMWASLVGISLAWEAGHAVYVPIRGPLGATTLEVEIVREILGPVLADAAVEKIGHNLKYDKIILENAGFTLTGKLFDTMIAAHVLDSSRMTYKMDALAMDMLAHKCIPIADVIGRGKKQIKMNTVPMDVVVPYAAEDADVTLRLADATGPKLADEGLAELFENVEMPLMPVLAEMERTGIAVDRRRLKSMEIELSAQADTLREQIIEAAGRPFNPDSPKQLAVILFDEMNLPVVKSTKTGPSTDSGVLEQLAVEHGEANPLPGLVLDYRKLAKLISTYLVALAQCINPDTGRVHTSFHQAAVATGRLSSSDPNLQNIPIRTAQGRQIRSAFVAAEGYKLLSADYSQVELRMLAHFCRDETLIAAFAADQDIHRIVAAEVFGVSLEDVTPDQRSRAKTVNFGIIYGQTAFGLAKTLRISRGQAGDFIKRYRARFPKIDEFLQTCIDNAKRDGYVETIFGRRRIIGEIDSRNPQRRNAAERLAINSVVQGSAADLIKQAMLNIAERIRRENRPAKMLLQIHDELVFEIPAEAIDAEQEMIVTGMTDAIELAVPLKVDVGTGNNWLEAK